ncbi:proline--tRNA ligase [Candidatus Woesearchaeota archaeon]|jgi:prolyl-tRNA synthetase|nr:proline--tRNA ligase [Candidatus Woesearchaeota archaeon]MBT4368117.1 proline--tRNA ligase [Candidatus Woesearchaeota archaeon]MBT4712605.1 proline--tRNA ligase [Candidatus Woesearchaeota archaeon]MBT6639518.1 proline--tRNA ligase [Candidatus Woesearchaeota archaeon]MBT7133690.1 proline--tRNA ligase [Candidatus Woesearchaeota archaeon]
MSKDEKGITAEKDEFSEWFTQIMLKADLADYTKVSGCIVFKPTAWAIWEKIRDLVDIRMKKMGVQNVSFPLFIPESLLVKEEEHVEGFTPEVAWVTHTGKTKLAERLAVRPTSEAIMYDSFSNWIRSWRDLPLKYNQWANVVRWEFKHPVPFLRTREFHFNEGHTVYATEAEAEAEKDQVLGMYKDICDNYLAMPSLIGKKTEKEKFAGAVYSCSLEHYMPNGKAIQGAAFHSDGQNFAKAYEIKFVNQKEKSEYAWQNTWAISTRTLGIVFALHSDDKGLIMPPKVAPNKVVIVPIIFADTKDKVLGKASSIKQKLEKYGTILDDREEYKPGFKFNEWEMKGIPIRIELGPKDLEKNSVMIARRDTGEKKSVKIDQVEEEVEKLLEEIQINLFNKAKKLLDEAQVNVTDLAELKKAIKDKKIAIAPLCKETRCEEDLKFKTGGAKVLNIPDEQPAKTKCVMCGEDSDYVARVGKSY